MRCNCGYKFKGIRNGKKQAKKLASKAFKLKIEGLDSVETYIVCPMCHSRRYF